MSELDRMAQYMIDGQNSPRAWDIKTGDSLTVNITALDAAGQQAARVALDAWANVSGINFRIVNNNAQITFDDRGGEGSTPTAEVSTNGRAIVSAEINITKEVFPGGRVDFFGHGYYTYLHEIGHALGLYHPGPYSGRITFGEDNEFSIDSYHTSVMSYFSQDQNPNTQASEAYPVTPMLADIIAIQKIYGVPENANTGDDVYRFESFGSGNPATYTIFDTGGDDTLDFSGANGRQTISLHPESASSVFGHSDVIVIARDTWIENAIGGSGFDQLMGNDRDNRLEGRDGDDRLWGSGGNDLLIGGNGGDRLDGGDGIDTVSYQEFNVGVTIKLTPIGEFADYPASDNSDVIVYVENIIAGSGADVLIGNDADNSLEGGAGADVFVFKAEGGNGLDTIVDFELGIDTIRVEPGSRSLGPDDVWYVYENGDLRIVIDTNGNGQRDSGDEYIILSGISSGFSDDDIDFGHSIDPPLPEPEPEEPIPPSGNDGEIIGTEVSERLTGTSRADTIKGRAGEDRLYGKDGNDILYGEEGNDVLEGGPGADILDGGPGGDYAYYLESKAGVLVRLHDNTARFGDAEGDVLISIEHLEGSEYNDTLAGDGGNNLLSGGGGDDTLYGGPAGGDDNMYGGPGDDRIFGGKGDDRLIGGEGIDIVNGGPGEDWFVIEGDDMDILRGGADNDRFEFSPSKLGGAIIRDFTNGQDRIDLTGFADINSINDMDITSIGRNVRIDLSGSDYLTTIILSDFNVNNLDNSDFLF